MRVAIGLLFLPSLALAFPGMASRSEVLQELKEHKRREAEHLEKRQSLVTALTSAVGTVTGLLGQLDSL